MDEATIGAFTNLATATAADRVVLTTLTEANTRLYRQLEEHSKEVKEQNTLLKKDHAERRRQRPFTTSLECFCWSHGYKVAKSHISQSCNLPKDGQKSEA
jgi:hypothetical protein